MLFRSADESTEILSKLSDLQIEYKHNANGDILVPSDVADTTRATLAQEGYPKSGFTYDVFINNAGGMTTDDENQTYKLYDLQNRIGATIRLFEGVKDAKVTIALGIRLCPRAPRSSSHARSAARASIGGRPGTVCSPRR